MTGPDSGHRGRAKIEFARKLGRNWFELADYFEIQPFERERFDRGREAEHIWQWLQTRSRLTELPDALRYLGRPDLANLLANTFGTDVSSRTVASASDGTEIPRQSTGGRIHAQLPKPRSLGRLRLVVVVVLVVAGATLAIKLGTKDQGGSGAQGMPDRNEPGGPPVSIDIADFALVPSQSPDTNDRDKVDLDTGCPGWGDMFPRIGPRRCGELADLIVDGDGLHNRDGRPSLLKLPADAASGYSVCRAGLDQEPSQKSIQFDSSDIRDGDEFCVETDSRSVGRVRIKGVERDGTGSLTSMRISFVVWKP